MSSVYVTPYNAEMPNRHMARKIVVAFGSGEVYLGIF